ncbi:hypothetical protein DYE48_02240 [Halobacillus trueperi]|uniref:Uncharacterized protein n=1 Tax=Halobacillus trueperi TaxID=156205 RepID=A0A3E0JEM9_9BACI|nr:hypothetical protein DYE48_02240 [Halobacillus trueperi]
MNLESFDTERFMLLTVGLWKTIQLGKGVRLTHTSNGVVGKLRDSRGNGLTGETPQSFSSRRLAGIPAGKRVASQPPLTLNSATNHETSRNRVFNNPPYPLITKSTKKEREVRSF